MDTQNKTIEQIIEQNSKILMEASIVETLRRNPTITLHPTLVNAPLIYSKVGGEALASIYNSYIDIAQENNQFIFLTTPTWRCNRERITSNPHFVDINIDSSRFLQRIKRERGEFALKIKIGGLIGCKNDCYKPKEGLSISEAMQFHSWQIGQLSEGEIDFLIAETIPTLEEAMGIAKVMERTSLPYFISFVINRDGFIIDGTSLINAIEKIDNFCSRKPTGYMVNCAHPTFLNVERKPQQLFTRLIGYLANASSKDHCDLDGCNTLIVDNIDEWIREMKKINNNGVKIIGGCCGTGVEHLQGIS